MLRFFQSLLSKKTLFLISIGSLSLFGYSDELSNTPGILESFETLIKVSKQRESQNRKSFQGKEVISTRKDLKLEQFKYSIDHSYIQSKLLKMNQTFSSSFRSQKCDFLEQLWFGLLEKTPGKRSNVLGQRKDKKSGFKEKIIIDSKIIAEVLAQDECPETMSLFNTIKKSSIESIIPKISLPNESDLEDSLSQCQQSFIKLKKSPYLNYLYHLSKILNFTQIKKKKSSQNNKERLLYLKSKKIQKILSYSQLNLIKDLQYNSSNDTDFCRSHLSEDIFKLVKKSPIQWKNFLTPYCTDILGKSKQLSRNEYHECLDKMQTDDSICSTVNNSYTNSLFPKQNCRELIENYNLSNFKKIAPDCPASVRNEGIINSSRVLSIYNKNHRKNNYVYYDHKNKTKCFEDHILNLEKHAKEFSIENLWGSYACYFNKVQREEICHKVAFFTNPSQELSATNVIGRILKDNKVTKYQPRCLFMRNSQLSSLGLKKSQGCHITYQNKNCSIDKCKIDIYLNGRKISNFITIKNKSRMEYFSYKNNSLSLAFHRSLKQKYKLKDSKVYNLTQLKEILRRKNVLVHGIGCAEDFLPRFFSRRTINQCKPLPFIIGGLKARTRALTSSILVNLSIDSMIDVRSYNWKSINNAVNNYQKTHPTRKWSLYALYQ